MSGSCSTTVFRAQARVACSHAAGRAALRGGLALLAALSLAAPRALAGVITVGPSASDHASLGAAIAAAVDGDILLVKTGTYAGFTLSGRGLSIVADQGADVRVTSRVRVEHVAATQSVFLSGLTITANTDQALVATDVQGSLRVASSTMRVVPDLSFAPVAAVVLENTVDAAFVDVVIRGGAPLQSQALAGAGLVLRGSRLALNASTIEGGAGAPGIYGVQAPGTKGGTGVVVESGTLSSMDSRLRGGFGGRGGVLATNSSGCASQRVLDGGGGGDGLFVAPGAQVELRASSALGAAGGLGGVNACGSQGFAGSPGAGVVGSATVVDEPVRGLRSNRVAREGDAVRFLCTGEPGDRVFLLVAWNAGGPWRSTPLGALWIQSPLPRRILLGTVPSTGSFLAGLSIPELGPGVGGALLHAQAWCLDAGGQSHLESGSLLTLLDRVY